MTCLFPLTFSRYLHFQFEITIMGKDHTKEGEGNEEMVESLRCATKRKELLEKDGLCSRLPWNVLMAAYASCMYVSNLPSSKVRGSFSFFSSICMFSSHQSFLAFHMVVLGQPRGWINMMKTLIVFVIHIPTELWNISWALKGRKPIKHLIFNMNCECEAIRVNFGSKRTYIKHLQKNKRIKFCSQHVFQPFFSLRSITLQGCFWLSESINRQFPFQQRISRVGSEALHITHYIIKLSVKKCLHIFMFTGIFIAQTPRRCKGLNWISNAVCSHHFEVVDAHEMHIWHTMTSQSVVTQLLLSRILQYFSSFHVTLKKFTGNIFYIQVNFSRVWMWGVHVSLISISRPVNPWWKTWLLFKPLHIHHVSDTSTILLCYIKSYSQNSSLQCLIHFCSTFTVREPNHN